MWRHNKHFPQLLLEPRAVRPELYDLELHCAHRAVRSELGADRSVPFGAPALPAEVHSKKEDECNANVKTRGRRREMAGNSNSPDRD